MKAAEARKWLEDNGWTVETWQQQQWWRSAASKGDKIYWTPRGATDADAAVADLAEHLQHHP